MIAKRTRAAAHHGAARVLQWLRLDIFISHDHGDLNHALRLEGELVRAGFSVWLDRDNVRAGTLLTNTIMEALNECRNIVVLWSRASAKSDWVQIEWTTIFNLNLQKKKGVKKGIIACRLDGTSFQPRGTFLVNYPYYDFRRSFDAGFQSLVQALGVKAAPPPRPEPYKPSQLVTEIILRQREVIETLSDGDVRRARALQENLDAKVSQAIKAQPSDRYVLILDGYNCKNRYMIRHWDALRAGLPPRDPLLDRAKRSFLRVLSRYPDDPEALNGVGSVLMFGRDLAGAEFYIKRALTEMKRQGTKDPVVEHALALIDLAKATPSPRDR